MGIFRELFFCSIKNQNPGKKNHSYQGRSMNGQYIAGKRLTVFGCLKGEKTTAASASHCKPC